MVVLLPVRRFPKKNACGVVWQVLDNRCPMANGSDNGGYLSAWYGDDTAISDNVGIARLWCKFRISLTLRNVVLVASTFTV